MASEKEQDEKPLSKRQKDILVYLYNCLQENRPPTIREICKDVKISSTSVVTYNIRKLEKRGLIDREHKVSRGLGITDKAIDKLRELQMLADEVIGRLRRIPLAGDIVASEPIFMGHDDFSPYDFEDSIEISVDMLAGQRGELYALKVRGESMIDAMVDDGDIVVLERRNVANNGDMVAAWLNDGTTTLKYFYREGPRVRLQPANPTMEAIYVNAADVQIQGKVIMVMRDPKRAH